MSAHYFTLEQKENIVQLFGLDFLDKLEEMKSSLGISFSKKKIPSESQLSLERNPSHLSTMDDLESKSDSDPNSPRNYDIESVTHFRNLLEALQFTPKINGPSDFTNENERLIANITEHAKKFKETLELKGACAHLIALAHLIFKPIAALSSYVAVVLLGAIIGGTVAAASPAIAPWGAVAGGVIVADIAKKTAKKLGITTQSMFSPAHRKARLSDNIEKVINEKVTYAKS